MVLHDQGKQQILPTPQRTTTTVCTVQNKNNIGKVMFMTAMVNPRYNEEGFDW
jgi:hypothetical protein